jgi:hypothetical protein
MRRPLIKLPEYQTSEILKDEKIQHAFFYKKDKEGIEYDFSTPLPDDLVISLLERFQLKKLIVISQKHTDVIAIYPSSDDSDFADAIITKEKKVGLLIRHADCQAALFFDPIKKVIAAVHAGFRGQVQEIYEKTIQKMCDSFGCHRENIKVATSPSLGLGCSEFINYQTEFPAHLHRFYKDGFMDLKKMAEESFLQSGLLQENIDISFECTMCNETRCHSYRKDRTIARMASLISIK